MEYRAEYREATAKSTLRWEENSLRYHLDHSRAQGLRHWLPRGGRARGQYSHRLPSPLVEATVPLHEASVSLALDVHDFAIPPTPVLRENTGTCHGWPDSETPDFGGEREQSDSQSRFEFESSSKANVRMP